MSVLTATTSRRWGDESRRIPLDLNVSCMFKHPSLDIIAVSGKGFIFLLDLQGKQVGKIEKGVENVQSVTFDPTGRWVFASVSPERRDGKAETYIKKWELAGILEGRGREGDEMVEIARLLTNNAATYLHDLADWPDLEITHILPTLESDIGKSLDAAILSRSLLLGHAQEGRFGSFGSQKFSNDGDCIILFVSRNKVCIVPLRSDRNPDRNRAIHTFSHPVAEEDGTWHNNEAIMWIGQSPDSRLYATVAWDKTAILWSAQTGEKLHTLTGPTGQNWVGAFAPNSEWFAVGGGDGKVYVFSTGTGELLQTLGGFHRWVRRMAVSKDGGRLIAGGSGSAQEFDTTSWNLLRLFKVKDISEDRFGSAEITNVQYAFLQSGEAVVFKMSDGRVFVFGGGVAIDNDVAHQGKGVGDKYRLEIDPAGDAASKGMGYMGSGALLVLEQETETEREVWSVDRDKCIRCWKLE
jgi:WD40 repeat protein